MSARRLPYRLLLTFLACFSVLLVCSASLRAGGVDYPERPLPEGVKDGQRLPFPALISQLKRNQVVFVGETHDRYDHHLNQLAILQALHQANPNIALGVEWFQQPFQPALTDFLAGRIDENEMLRRTGYFDRWRYDYRLIRPIMEYAKANHLVVMALNAPTELTHKISEGGLRALSPHERAQLPSAIAPPDESYRERLRQIFDMHSKEQGQFEHFTQVQRVWDETMAANIARFLKLNPHYNMVVFAGSGHISHGSGIPQDLATLMPDIKQTTVASTDPNEIQPDVADYSVLTEPLSLPPLAKLGVWLNNTKHGLQIGEMAKGSAASQAGLRKGDRLLRLNRQKIQNMADLMLTLTQYQPGEPVNVSVERAGKPEPLVFKVVLQ